MYVKPSSTPKLTSIGRSFNDRCATPNAKLLLRTASHVGITLVKEVNRKPRKRVSSSRGAKTPAGQQQQQQLSAKEGFRQSSKDRLRQSAKENAGKYRNAVNRTSHRAAKMLLKPAKGFGGTLPVPCITLNCQLPITKWPRQSGRRWGQRRPQGANSSSNSILKFLPKLKQWLR